MPLLIFWGIFEVFLVQLMWIQWIRSNYVVTQLLINASYLQGHYNQTFQLYHRPFIIGSCVPGSNVETSVVVSGCWIAGLVVVAYIQL